jgi:predicted regulator of Ras-like GTPase activity (Roadblock/LC7/MglB family)
MIPHAHTAPDTHTNELGWLLDEHLGTVDGVRSAALVTSDGLIKSYTDSLSQDDAEKLAALTSALRTAARTLDDFLGGGGVRQQLVECVDTVFLATAAGENATLSVVTTGAHADVGLISTHMVQLATQLGDHLRAQARRPDGDRGVAG